MRLRLRGLAVLCVCLLAGGLVWSGSALAAGGSVLPDGRQWELVSPAEKYGAQILPVGAGLGLAQAGADGGAVTYEANAPIVADPEGNVSGNTQGLSVRGAGGWSTQDVSPPQETPTRLRSVDEYQFFSEDLSLGLFNSLGNTALPPLPKGSEKTIYLREAVGGNGRYTALVSAANVPSGTVIDPHGRFPVFVGATPDLRHIVIRSPANLTSNATEGGLFEWVGGQLQLVTILPNEEPTSGTLGNSDQEFGVRHAISNDGTRIVWEAGTSLYVRDTASGKTIQVGLTGENRAPQFQIASNDGSRIFYTEEGSGLYEYEIGTGLTTDLTSGTPIQGSVLGASEDGTDVYFASNGALARGAAPGNCEGFGGVSGTFTNLYYAHERALTFIAALSCEDARDWGELEGLGGITSRVSSDGQYMTFMSDRSLTGYDNTDVSSGVADEEVFLYDAHTNRLVCASCNPTGARPAGVFSREFNAREPGGELLVDPQGDLWGGRWLAGSIPGGSSIDGPDEALYQPRVLSDSGRLFFDSSDALVPEDVNGKEDVYEYEPVGVGSCEAAAATFSSRSDGCVGLISSGTSSEESAFLDASADGDDVFFLTTGQLVPADVDTNQDLYDAHVCSAAVPCPAPAVSVLPPCSTAEACRTVLPSGSGGLGGVPASSMFSGAGNLQPAVVSPPAKATPKAKKRRVKKPNRKRHKRAGKEKAARSRSAAVSGTAAYKGSGQ